MIFCIFGVLQSVSAKFKILSFVKETEDNTDYFCYRFVGANFDKKINNIEDSKYSVSVEEFKNEFVKVFGSNSSNKIFCFEEINAKFLYCI